MFGFRTVEAEILLVRLPPFRYCLRSKVTANVASPAVDLTPQHAAWLLELVVAVSTTCHCLSIVSYLLSPGHLLVLVYRLVLQVQFTLPRRVHAARSFRFFVLLWGVQAIAAVTVHGATGSQGTKGPKGYVQRGLVLDFVGQAYTPSTVHLVTLDVLLAVLQLATLILAFGATVPSDLDATTDAEGSRDYSSLLGIDQDDTAEGGHTDDQDDILFDGGEWIGTSSRTRAGYEPVNIRGSDPLDPYGDPSRNQGPSGKYYTALGPSAQRLTVPIPLIASLRLRTVWREIRKSARDTAAEREEGGLRGMEEGRGPS
ncbi:hypothetical protein BMF94_3664 [Rhodotorula taiwanensis]|uniref:DUF1746 domain-containing protein n=1 Tax=Rhodotorula taiwanensis TaxID=741276 RepID=A0A2S5B998_9BASI|nr:hypothetical protein BMF94_3664 [Rhodotorula taiwanensis]